MSSVCGIVDLEAKTFDFERLRDMGRSMVLRGKDQSGAYIKGGVGFHHNRCVFHSWAEGRQPYSALKNGKVCTIVFDGELYNIGKISDIFGLCGFESAAEAALKCYIAFGYECLEQMEGRFAFAIYDEERSEVFLARDSIGAKPLYYLKDGAKLIFSSEIKGLLRYSGDGLEIDRRAITELIIAPAGMVRGADIYKGIEELPEGSFALHSRLGTQVSKYKNPRDVKIMSVCANGARIVSPSVSPKIPDIEAMLHEMLVAFDYPTFDEYLPAYADTVKKNAHLKNLAILDRAMLMDMSYSLERADRIGGMNGVSITPLPPEEDVKERRSWLGKLDRALSATAEKILCDENSYIRKYLGSALDDLVQKEKDPRRRLRSFGKIIQTEQWLSSYSVLPI